MTMPLAKSLTTLSYDDYLKMTMFCPTFFVIEVKEIKEESGGIEDGAEIFKVTVTGKVVEVIRGEHNEKEFINISPEIRIVNVAEAMKVHGRLFVEACIGTAEPLASRCKAGHRYLVIFYDDMTYYYKAPKDDENWRKGILEFNEEFSN